MTSQTDLDIDTPQLPEQTPTVFIRKRTLVLIIVLSILLMTGLVIGIVYLMKADAATAQQIRDVFFVFIAFEFILIGATLVILALQLAVMINLIQNEIKPILDTTNEAINTIRGTASFMSDNLVEPVIKLNEYVAALRKIVSFFRLPWR
jgi:hypothetical protein